MKFRYIAASFIIALSIAVTPLCIEAARSQRGYEAYGGEYLVIPLGVVAAIYILNTAGFIDHMRNMLKKSQKHGSIQDKERTGVFLWKTKAKTALQTLARRLKSPQSKKI